MIISINKDKLQNFNGFTLIEVVIAIAVITIGMFATMSLAITVIKGNAHSRNVTTATNVAEDTMENLKRAGYLNVADQDGNTDDYYWQVDVVENGTPTTNMKTIIVDVFWSPATTTSAHNVQLQTMITP